MSAIAIYHQQKESAVVSGWSLRLAGCYLIAVNAFFIEMLLLIPLLLVWFVVVTVIVRPFGIRMPLRLSDFSPAYLVVAAPHVSSIRSRLRRSVFRMWNVYPYDPFPLPRMEVFLRLVK
jgi:hypothetical protein